MIIDHIDNAYLYMQTHPGLAPAFYYLEQHRFDELPDGEINLIDDRLRLIVSRTADSLKPAPRMEAHRRYIDVHVYYEGEESVGFKRTADCAASETGYDETGDVEFFSDAPEQFYTLKAGYFMILWPDDGHAPLSSNTPLHKAIFKAAVDWGV